MKVYQNTATGEIVDTIGEAIHNTIENVIKFHFFAPHWIKVET